MNNKKRIIIPLLAMLFVASFAAMQGHLSRTAQQMAKQGLVNIQSIDQSIKVSLMYTRPDNFCGTVLYTDLKEAFLHPKAAQALAKAQKELKKLHPNLSLIVFDATRPISIQRIMWNKVKGTSKQNYVSNPANGGGLHNYGMAVDISICNAKGDTLDMGTKVDYMGSASHIDKEQTLVAKKIISKQSVKNRQLLRTVMQKAGFKPLRTEWWHFNLISRTQAKRYYKVVK